MSRYKDNKPYIKTARGDRILLKTRMVFGRGCGKPQRSFNVFWDYLDRVDQDRKALESGYTVIALPRNGGKMAYMIQKAIREGGAIAVTREETKQGILQTAAIMGVDPPEVVVLKKKDHLERGFTLAGAIIDVFD